MRKISFCHTIAPAALDQLAVNSGQKGPKKAISKGFLFVPPTSNTAASNVNGPERSDPSNPKIPTHAPRSLDRPAILPDPRPSASSTFDPLLVRVVTVLAQAIERPIPEGLIVAFVSLDVVAHCRCLIDTTSLAHLAHRMRSQLCCSHPLPSCCVIPTQTRLALASCFVPLPCVHALTTSTEPSRLKSQVQARGSSFRDACVMHP
jgi:hypothetical protein